jgi:hypothetical protein
VYDVLGRKLRARTVGMLDAGYHSTTEDCAGLPAGQYLAVIECEEGIKTGAFTVVR